MTRLALALMWLLHGLPARVLALLGAGLGMALYTFGRERRSVVLINLALCFPRMPEKERNALARRHLRAFGRSFLERAILWWSPAQRVADLVQVEGREHLHAVAGRPVILLAPHFVGFDMGGARIQLDHPVVSVYSRQKNEAFDRLLLHGRLRLNAATRLYSRQEGIRPVIRAMRQGLPFYYLPDMDFGARDAVFVPFLGVPAATITGLARIAALADAAVIPCVTRQLPDGQGYVVRYYPAWEQFPGEDPAADVRRMNAFIEECVCGMPEQYYWLHKRFKTRPAGDRSPYERAR